MTNLTEGAAFARGGPVRRALHVVFPPPARRRIWLWVTRGGPVADLYFWLDPRTRSRRVTRKTDIVIDGMARSANSYAHVAFLLTNGESLNISHHLHTPRVIERGVRFGIPTIVLIRDPRAVLASVIQYDKDGSAEQFLDAYLSYYRTVEPLLDRVVLADFTEVIADFGGVIDLCNAKFGTSFARYERTDEGEAAIVAKIDEIMATVAAPEDLESKTPRPSELRRSVDEVLADLGPENQAALAEAERLYARLRPGA
ncbi:hypothetical protein [Aeromicrobium sp.]|uniref:hypothetical protein n=1 Tax=Aeromicrobium sp. TaxID=1871063 RepID=UPI003C6040E9